MLKCRYGINGDGLFGSGSKNTHNYLGAQTTPVFLTNEMFGVRF